MIAEYNFTLHWRCTRLHALIEREEKGKFDLTSNKYALIYCMNLFRIFIQWTCIKICQVDFLEIGRLQVHGSLALLTTSSRGDMLCLGYDMFSLRRDLLDVLFFAINLPTRGRNWAGEDGIDGRGDFRKTRIWEAICNKGSQER